ncbi:uncharacterized protein LOC121878194 [Homarus americanus]|uniref:uncharacterized protein LOC121878194 n=1 Tax=Homarus americanus TaxID=6706 RepID=UPI001C493B02|nr:uncharacterized protein LOC121878194 [Homarus americanus]
MEENQFKKKDAIPLQLPPTEIAADTTSVTTVEQSSDTGGDVAYSDTGAAAAAAEQSSEGGAVADSGTGDNDTAAEQSSDTCGAVADSDIGGDDAVNDSPPNLKFYEKLREKRKKKVLAENNSSNYLPLCGDSIFEQINAATSVSVPVDATDGYGYYITTGTGGTIRPNTPGPDKAILS